MKQTNILDIYNTLQILAVLIHIVVITECGTKEKILMVMKPETNVPAYNYFTNSIFSWYKEPYAHLWSTEHFINANITGFRSPLLNSWNELKVTKISCLLMNDYNDTLVSIHFDGTGKTLEDWYSNPTSEDFNNTQFNMTGLYAFDFLITHENDTRLIKGGALFGGHSGVSTRQNKILFVLGDEFLQLPIYGSKCIVGILPKAKFSYPVEKGEDCIYQCYRVGTNSAIVTTDISNMYPYHKCLCFNNPPSLPMANGCGVPCYGDGSKRCGDKTKDIYVQYNTSIISEYFLDTEEELIIVNVHIPASTAVTTMMDSFTTMIKAGMCALLNGMTVLPNGGPAPAITMRISKSNCTDFKTFNSENGTAAVFDNFNELYEFDNLMVRCIVLNNTGNLPVDVMLHFRSSTVIIASMLAVVAEMENDQCQLVDITLAEEFLDMSQIDTWYGENGTNVSGITTDAGLRLGYKDFAPPPEIIMKVSKNPYGKTAWMKEIHLETNSEHVVMFMDGNCSGNYIIWLVQHQGQALSSGNYLHSIVTTSAETFCLEKIHLTLYQPNNDHYFIKAEMYGCLSYGKPANCSDTVDFFQNGIIPLGNVMVHSSHSMPNAIFPCMPALNIDRMDNNLPLKITLIVPKDDRVDSLPVQSIAVEGHEVSSINISSMSSRDDSDFGLISAAFYRYTTNTVFVLFTPNKQIFAFRITHHTTSDHYEITSINVTTCVYNEQILRKINVSYNGSCDETTTESVTTTTSPETTTTSPETTTTSLETTTTSPETTTTSPEITTNPDTTTTLTKAQTTMASPTTTMSPDPTSLPETTTASSEHNTTPETTTVASANNQCCICIPIPETITTQEAEKKAEELKKDLIVDKSTLSSTKRKKTSANDDRPSAKMVGSLGVILLTVAIGLVVAMDANYIVKAFKKISAWRKFKRLKNQTSELE